MSTANGQCKIYSTRLSKQDGFRLEDLAEGQNRSVSNLMGSFILKGIIEEEYREESHQKEINNDW